MCKWQSEYLNPISLVIHASASVGIMYKRILYALPLLPLSHQQIDEMYWQNPEFIKPNKVIAQRKLLSYVLHITKYLYNSLGCISKYFPLKWNVLSLKSRIRYKSVLSSIFPLFGGYEEELCHTRKQKIQLGLRCVSLVTVFQLQINFIVFPILTEDIHR